MATDEIAVFRPAVQEMLRAGPGWCVTFSDEQDEDAWVQVSDDLLNFAYPYKREPRHILSLCGQPGLVYLKTVSWEPGKMEPISTSLSLEVKRTP